MKLRYIIVLLLWGVTAYGQQVIMQHPPIWVYQGGAVPPASDLILQYLMGANGDEANITLDTSSNDTTGTVTDATWVGATNGLTDLYDFDGSGDFVTFSDVNLPSGSVARTISTWVKNDADATGVYFDYGTQAALQSCAGVFISGGDWQLGLNTRGVKFNKPFDGNWHHIVWVFPTNGASIADIIPYYDGIAQVGILVGADAVPNTVPNEGFLGKNIGSPTYFNGKLWDYEVLDVGLSASEVLATNRAQSVALGITGEYVNDNLAANLVFDWEANSLLDDGSTNHIALTTASAPTMVGDNTNGWGSFNGSANLITMGDPVPLDISGAFTLAAWVYMGADATGGILAKDANGGNDGSVLFYASSEDAFRFKGNGAGGNDFLLDTAVIALSNWYHVACVYDGADAFIYLDGLQQDTSSPGSDNYLDFNAVWTLGAFTGDGSPINALMEQIIIWDKGLSSNQVYNLSQSARGE